MHIADSIFRTYDIRGIYPTELDEQTAEVLGKGFGSFFKTKQIKNIVVGRDNRPSSPSLAKVLWKDCLQVAVMLRISIKL